MSSLYVPSKLLTSKNLPFQDPGCAGIQCRVQRAFLNHELTAKPEKANRRRSDLILATLSGIRESALRWHST
eukprot:336070-Amphidinium_carterae.1